MTGAGEGSGTVSVISAVMGVAEPDVPNLVCKLAIDGRPTSSSAAQSIAV